MNSPEPIEEAKRSSVGFLLLRCSIAFLLPVIFLLLVAFTVVFLALFISNIAILYPISVPCQCKIVSSSVDLRSTKVCELGLLNYKGKRVVYKSEKKIFRCRYEYYWASVFKVEYTDHSGHPHTALVETPNEALPLDCRRDFNGAWMAKDRFKVNETYGCWYTLGISKLNLHYDEYFNCQAEHPSMTEMLTRRVILSTEMLISWLFYTGQGGRRFVRWEVIDRVVTGFLAPLITLAFGRMLYLVKSHIVSIGRVRDVYMTRLQHAYLVAYFSFVGWLAVRYWEKHGL